MSLLYVVSWISLLFQICFMTVSVGTGLYYLAELVEEYVSAARRTILLIISFITFLYILFIFLDNLPWSMVLCGVGAQIIHFVIMANFPFIRFLSFSFIGAIGFLIVNHVLAFQYFTSVYYSFQEVLGYFTICLWLVPLSLFVSLSANDNVLPTTITEQSRLMGHHDVVSHYFSRGKKQGLLSLFNYLKENMLPMRSKKGF